MFVTCWVKLLEWNEYKERLRAYIRMGAERIRLATVWLQEIIGKTTSLIRVT